jgi:hypothetical protein
VAAVKNWNFYVASWLSCLSWQLGPARWWLVAGLLSAFLCTGLAMYWHYETSLVDEEVESVLQKIKNKRMANRQTGQISQTNQTSQTAQTNRSVKPVSNAGLSVEQETLMELRLPPVQATKASPLGKYLGEAKLKGVAIKQVDYVWAKSTRNLGQNLGVGRIEVNLNMEGSYPAVRAWLGELLYEESNIQINSIQFQRLARDSLTISSAISLSVYFQEAK